MQIHKSTLASCGTRHSFSRPRKSTFSRAGGGRARSPHEQGLAGWVEHEWSFSIDPLSSTEGVDLGSPSEARLRIGWSICGVSNLAPISEGKR